MNITFKTSGYELTAGMKAFVESKIKNIEKLLGTEGTITLCEIELGRVTESHRSGAVYRAEANVDTGKKLFRATAEGETMEAAVDTVEAELMREIGKERGRARQYLRRGGAALKSMLRGFRS